MGVVFHIGGENETIIVTNGPDEVRGDILSNLVAWMNGPEFEDVRQRFETRLLQETASDAATHPKEVPPSAFGEPSSDRSNQFYH